MRYTKSVDVLCYRLASTDALDDWAYLYITAKGTRLEMMIRTDFGCWENIWANIGHGDWRAFLINLDNAYLTGKLAPEMLRAKRSKKSTDYAMFLRVVWPCVKDMLMKDLQADGHSTIVTS